MEQDEFKAILDEATKGKPAAMSIILQIYDPLIKHYSYIHGRKDEDLKQHLTLHIIKKISKFKIEWGGVLWTVPMTLMAFSFLCD